jgi:hypothetical protein
LRDPLAHTIKKALAVFFILAISCAALAVPVAPDKVKPEEIVAKHLAAIGPADALTAIKSRVMIGTSTASTGVQSGNIPVEITGPAQFASEGEKVVFAMIFNSKTYPHEKAGFNGEKLTVGILAAGRRSELGDFLVAHSAIFKQGLIGGVLSSAWPLLGSDAKSLKLSYAGTKTVNDRPAHELKMRSVGDLQVSLFFDTETFQHLRTEYKYTIPAPMATVATDSPNMKESHFKLMEDFSDFKTTGSKLTLPHTYKLSLTTESVRGTKSYTWKMNFLQFAFNQPLEAEAFNVAASR